MNETKVKTEYAYFFCLDCEDWMKDECLIEKHKSERRNPLEQGNNKEYDRI